MADLQNITEQPEFDDLSDADYPESSHAVNQGRQGSVGVHPEDRVAPSDREFDDITEPGFPVRVNVTIEKPNGAALLIQTTAQDGVFDIEDVAYFPKADLAYAKTAEKDWDRQSLYGGPPFENLDEELQKYFELYLEERGINSELANVIPDYIQVKEQNEYVRWLESKLIPETIYRDAEARANPLQTSRALCQRNFFFFFRTGLPRGWYYF